MIVNEGGIGENRENEFDRINEIKKEFEKSEKNEVFFDE